MFRIFEGVINGEFYTIVAVISKSGNSYANYNTGYPQVLIIAFRHA